jgi:asparagine synthase (glutamine-hydrolysing)
MGGGVGLMCGISGFVQSHRLTEDEVTEAIKQQLACQRHRGPDAEGWFAGGHGVVGQNRLSVIDLVRGDPPVTNEDESIGVALNGEIYNFRPLRDQLLRAGHTMRTSGDTEVLAHLAEDHDAVGIASKLDGMFAFAAWDRQRQILMLGRDRMGKKPLYFWHSSTTFVFGSEIKAVLAHPRVSCELDGRAVDAYLTFGYVPTPYTFFEGVRSLPPGHVLTLRPGGEPATERYWRFEVPGLGASAPALDLSLDEAAVEVRRLLQRAIRRRLIADVPLGAFLSGGIDSSAIVALMAGEMETRVKTFTIGFDDRNGFDERPYARLVASRFGTDHHEEVVNPEAVELVERLVWHHDQPFGDSSAVPTFLLNQAARKHVTVALSGDGGDELFAGYERFAAGIAANRALALPAMVRRAARRGLSVLPSGGLHGRIGSLQRFAQAIEPGLPWAYLSWISYVPERWRRRQLEAPDDWARLDYDRLWRATEGAETLDRLLALNIETYLLDDLLVKMDRTSMAHGLEVRSPFLDTDLVEFTSRLAPGLKIRGLSLKRVLKQAMAELLPGEVIHRRKHGFGVPLDRWFREDLESYTRSVLGTDARVRRHVNNAALDALLEEHRTHAANHGHALWTLLTLELFLRRYRW